MTIDQHVTRLTAALGLPAPEGAAPGGPFGQLRFRLKDIATERLLTLKVQRSWLHALSCMVREVPMEGSMIIPAVFPPAAMLAEGFQGSDADKQIIGAGAVACIRSPKNELLILSPASPAAAVYELNDGGLVKLADSVVAFAQQQVDAAVSG